MKPSIIHSMVVCLAAFALPFMVACSSQEESLPNDVTEAVLYLNIEPIGETKANAAELPDNEKMHSVRVIVLHEDGTVEHNKPYPLENALSQKYIWLKVKPNEKKKIYLFANEESVTKVEGVTVEGENQSLTAFFDSYAEGMSGFEDAVNGLYFTPDYTDENPIPMSSMYEIDFKEGRENYQFYLVRAATKFSYHFKNFRDGDVKVNNITIKSINKNSYLMAHKKDLYMSFDDGNSNLYWIDWLKKVSDESQRYPDNPDNENITYSRGWIKDYDVPQQNPSLESVTVNAPQDFYVPEVTVTPAGIAQAGKASLPTFYLPESKNLKTSDKYGDQEYKMFINLTDEDGKTSDFEKTFSNLEALFRNTHVVVDVTFLENEAIMVVDVVPYTGIWLDPDFGIDR